MDDMGVSAFCFLERGIADRGFISGCLVEPCSRSSVLYITYLVLVMNPYSTYSTRIRY